MPNERRENGLSAQITDIAKRGAEWYTDKSILRAIINTIPYIGGPIDVFISTEGQNIIQRRICDFIEQLRLELKDVKEEQVNKDFLNSEEFFDMIVAAFESASRTKEIEKINLYAKIIKNSVVIVEADFSSLEYIKIITELSLQEFLVVKQLYETRRFNIFDDSSFSEFENMTRDKFNFLLKRIERAGLIYEYRQPGGIASSSINYKFSNIIKNIFEYLE